MGRRMPVEPRTVERRFDKSIAETPAGGHSAGYSNRGQGWPHRSNFAQGHVGSSPNEMAAARDRPTPPRRRGKSSRSKPAEAEDIDRAVAGLAYARPSEREERWRDSRRPSASRP